MSQHRHRILGALDAPHDPYATPVEPARVPDRVEHGEPPADWTIAQRVEHSTDQLLAALQDVRAQLTRVREPARYRVVQLTADAPIITDQAGDTWASVGILNANPYTILLGINGPASSSGHALPVPANSSLVLPIHVQDLEVGAAPADIALYGTALVHVFRYRTVQRLDLAAWA